MSTLTAPSRGAVTAQLLTENWLRNVFSSDLYDVRGRADADPDGDHTPAVVVTHAHAGGDDPPVLVVSISDAPLSADTVEDAGRHAAAGVCDFWVIEVGARRVHIFRDPQPDADAKHGYSYRQVERPLAVRARRPAGRGDSPRPGGQPAAVVARAERARHPCPALPCQANMTEADWLTGTDFTVHVGFVADQLAPRRQRLLAAGFCRAVAHLFDHPDLNAALAVVEWYADGRESVAELEKARQACRVLAQQSHNAYARQVDGDGSGAAGDVRHELAWAVAYAAGGQLTLTDVGNHAANAAVQALTGTGLLVTTPSTASAEQSLVMRGVVWDVVGNPFRPVEFAPERRTDTAVALARHIYDRREFSAMPILADALQDAGCDSDAVLNHCRHEGTHVRGCWVLDGVLGRE